MDRGIDLLDYYRGKISTRRMWLLVVEDRARMPRLSARLSGVDPDRQWSETNTQLALLWGMLQHINRVLWVGLRLQGEPPAVREYPIPGLDSEKRGPEKPKFDSRKMAYLDRFAPPTSKRRHLRLVKGGEQSA